MNKTKASIIAGVMLIAMILNILSNINAPIYADISTVDKLMQNERLINVQDMSYSYRDIEKHWAKGGMYKLSYMEILTGFVDGTMKPDKTLTRDEYIVMLVRAIDLPMTNTYDQYYEDISTNHWSFQYIQTAKASGIIDIFDESNLNPTKVISREEMAVIAAAVVKDIPQIISTKSFKDLKADYKYMDSINIVTGMGIIRGLPDGTFKPYAGASRAEAAVIIQRILDVNYGMNNDETNMLQTFAENYEKSSMTNPNQGSLSSNDLMLYSMGKEYKQNDLRMKIMTSFEQQDINLIRDIEDMNISVTSLTKYLGEASLSYKLNYSTVDGISREYNVNRKLYLKKSEGSWLVYNSNATYSRANAIDQTEKINLAWQYLSQSTPDMSNVAKLQGLNVISPTWFVLSNGSGDIRSIADVRYSNWAHKNGYQVWALVTNDFNKDMTAQMLANPAYREKAVNTLIQYAKDYKLDGINVDFENMYTKDKDLFTLFVKELYQKTKPLGIVLSVDVTVIVKNSNWSESYDRKALAQVSDYIALMAYDQHWVGSPISGSVSQLKWVEDSLIKVLLEVPQEKLILGMPFYTRVWQEEYDANNKLVVTSRAVSMEYAEQLIAENKAVKTWDAVSGQYYATYKKGEATYKIWLEDENSIKLRVELANKYNLAGVASWKLGFEKPGIWDVIAAALNKKIASN
ncbi:MAG TPA: glycosyl hydrolase family 18 protein [Patescibacteria group bacterium]|nr:glycosyl hydrolase family 18 protein [Patescibacteria group bacterium]